MKAKKRTSEALVELRTVASRAATALAVIKDLPQQRERYRRQGAEIIRLNGAGCDMANMTGYWERFAEDPEEPEMIAALEQVCALLERWRK